MKNIVKITGIVLAALAVFLIASPGKGGACTGITLRNQDGSIIQARTMEFGQEMIWFDLIFVPRGIEYNGMTPAGAPGMAWKVKYAHVGFSPFGISVLNDGMNEKGLSCMGFFMPGFAKYQDVTTVDYPDTISCLDFASWILGNCASAAEVREMLPKIKVCGTVLKEWGIIPPLHFIVTDETGDSIVIEYVDGKLNIYDNKVGVITNSPSYDWHMANLRNYIGLKADNNPPITVNGVKIEQFGQGSGGVGLPGDFTPTSRFVQAYFLVNNIYPGKDSGEGVENAFRILNRFDIPKGAIRDVENGKVTSDTTQWTGVADLKNRIYYFHTYHDRQVRMIDLNKLDLNAGKIKIINIPENGKPEDITGKLK